MSPADLLAFAADLNNTPTRGALRQAYLRRSISTSYYALFHALARLCADQLVGSGKAKSEAWTIAYRALDHRMAKNVLVELARRDDTKELKWLADSFAELQQLRHEADYDPHARYTLGEAGPTLRLAELVISILRDLSPDTKLLLAVTLLTKIRR